MATGRGAPPRNTLYGIDKLLGHENAQGMIDSAMGPPHSWGDSSEGPYDPHDVLRAPRGSGPDAVYGPNPDPNQLPDTPEQFQKLFGREPATDTEMEFYYGSPDEAPRDDDVDELIQQAMMQRR